MAQPYTLIYTQWGSYEVAQKYYWASDLTGSTAIDVAEELKDALKDLLSATANISRWEYYSALGALEFDGTYSPTPGTVTGDMQPFQYALLIRLNSGGGGRKSVKYVHGWSENFQANGALSTGGSLAITAYGAELLSMSATLVDSDGAPITGVTFRGFSRRKRLRHLDA